MNSVKSVFAATAILSAAMMGNAAAMPTAHLGTPAQAKSGLQDVRWVCGPVRCWWRPNLYNFYGPGWRRGWGPGWRGGWGGVGWRRGWGGPGWRGGWRRW